MQALALRRDHPMSKETVRRLFVGAIVAFAVGLVLVLAGAWAAVASSTVVKARQRLPEIPGRISSPSPAPRVAGTATRRPGQSPGPPQPAPRSRPSHGQGHGHHRGHPNR